ncbi:nuclear transport factor 2 family protein [uncultured Maritimibacter sp.]|uniref:nuclear transport factor 2 family protein n=1 Tax=uncultured Maritimibacter sp. TaxID=991866 RepID=UPI0025968B18|nr:nuclear transport factor 2 family protein [uncultured Maritimibacter sp.]
MDPQAARDVIAKAWHAIDVADWDTLRALGHKDSAIRSGATEWHYGPDGIAALFAHYRENYDLDMRDYRTIVMGDKAAVETRLKLTYRTTKAGFPEARGQSTIVPVGSFITFREGLFFRTQMILSIDDWMRVFTADPDPDFAGQEGAG